MSSKLKAGALFSGIGGFCIGFKNSNIDTVWAVEQDVRAVDTYKNNLDNVRVIADDIKKVSVEKNGLEPVDVLHAGFPCQSFSQAGGRKGFDDPRGQLFFEIIRLIKEFGKDKPSVLVFENSPYLKIGDNGSWFLKIEKEIKKAGYWFREANAHELDAFNVSIVPQKRNRLFMVAFSIKHFKNGKFDFPSEQGLGKKDLSKFVDFKKQQDDYYYLPENNRYFDMIKDHEIQDDCLYQLRKYLVRTKETNTCPTLTANMGQGGHNVPFIINDSRVRKLTEYECLRLQGFPNWFKFPESVPRANRYMQIGNAVAVPVAELLAQQVYKKINEERRTK
ncbi:hypothetical protein BCU94_18500 [Shewanella sp. 10N.286.52.C2]|uniref:DNA cytosine methyltransferase n=1 Tax=Shewanella sp. 10N.286.52.C2 TaxID=1880838 RepID=UPI000C82F619|nr:DNA (cytosine-5-)-methyltransferase [Shewanella sp. 10N.286.52.C2]PMG28021.1 hypothetical protein BCU94_18500 [Shewanella sp. 10N.286.52.C2]